MKIRRGKGRGRSSRWRSRSRKRSRNKAAETLRRLWNLFNFSLLKDSEVEAEEQEEEAVDRREDD